MGERRGPEKEGKAERASRFLRDVNAIGALAIGGAAILAPPVAAVGLGIWAGINAIQAGGFEAARRYAKKHRKN